METENRPLAGEKVTEHIRLCPDGVYRWTYEYKMLKNPTVLFTVWKVLGVTCGILFVFGLIIRLFDGGFGSWDELLGMGKSLLAALGVCLALGVLGYLGLGLAYGFKYQVLFEMTDKYVRHIQMPKQFKRAQALGWLTALAGAAAGRPGAVGIGLISAARSTMTTELENVAVLKIRRRRETIHVNQKLDRNQVYAPAADFDFVERFLRAHCPRAKVK